MKDIEGFEGVYAITRDCKIWSFPREVPRGRVGRRSVGNRFLKPAINGAGYHVVQLSKGKRGKNIMKQFLVHRLFAIAFLPNPSNYKEINHINGKKTDNRIENLEWCTHGHNVIHSAKIGLSPAGERHYRCKYSDKMILSLRSEYHSSNKYRALIPKLAKQYGIPYKYVHQLLKGKRKPRMMQR